MLPRQPNWEQIDRGVDTYAGELDGGLGRFHFERLRKCEELEVVVGLAEDQGL